MPKRSNEFQRLIHYLYTQLVPAGVKVTESAMVPECDVSVDCVREVDILLEYEIAGTTIRVAVECRDRTRKDDIAWIDGLIGKYSRIDVNKVVAVSNSGFSAAALEKARSHQIDARTLQAALDANWPSEFMRLGIASTTRNSHVRAVILNAEPPLQEKMRPDNLVSSRNILLGTLDHILGILLDTKVFPDLEVYVRDNFTAFGKSVADLSRTLPTRHRYSLDDVWLTNSKSMKHKVNAITFEMLTTFVVQRVPVEHGLFSKACVTSGIVPSAEEDSQVLIRAVQFADKVDVKLLISPVNNSGPN